MKELQRERNRIRRELIGANRGLGPYHLDGPREPKHSDPRGKIYPKSLAA